VAGIATAGAAWYAASLLPLLTRSDTVGRLHLYPVNLHQRLPGETGKSVSFHRLFSTASATRISLG